MYTNNKNKDSLDDISKIPYITFLRIGETLISNDLENNLENDINYNFEDKIKELETIKIEFTEEIRILSLLNKKLSDSIKENEIKLQELSNKKFLFFSKSNKQNLQKILENDTKLYDKNFTKISDLYEQLIEITEQLKNLEGKN